MNIKQAEFIFENEALNLSKEKIHFHTIQFLTREKSKFIYDYKPYGSCVLVKIRNQFLIFTASHIPTDVPNNSLYVNTRIGEQQVIGFCHQTDFKSDSFLDVAYIILDKMLGLLISEKYEFLPIEKICHSHIPKETTNYMVSGYPVKNIWKNDGDIYTGSSHFLLSMANQKAYKYYSIDPEKNYVLNFAGKGIDIIERNHDRIDDPHGISGCGLWFLQARLVAGKMVLEYVLIGIMALFKKSKYHVLIGNKVELIMADIEKELGINFDWGILSK